jgi:hypothetical protein
VSGEEMTKGVEMASGSSSAGSWMIGREPKRARERAGGVGRMGSQYE